MKKLKILICNDDGYKAAGIHVLARVMSKFGDVTVVAPKFHQSATSMAVSLGVKQLAYKDLPEERPGKWTYLDATPASCVKFGLEFKYENRDPDLVVTGINHGTNASMAANYSGTLGAAEEAVINGCKAIGVSLCDFRSDADFSVVEELLPGIIKNPDCTTILTSRPFPGKRSRASGQPARAAATGSRSSSPGTSPTWVSSTIPSSGSTTA